MRRRSGGAAGGGRSGRPHRLVVRAMKHARVVDPLDLRERTRRMRGGRRRRLDAALHRATDLAYARLLESGSGMPISLGGDRSVPHFAHNTWRRMADTAAQQCHANGGCSEEDIDLHMGWQLKKHARKMRLHYANRGQRAARALITAMI